MSKKDIILNSIKELKSVNNKSDEDNFKLILNFLAYKLGIRNSMYSGNINERAILDKIDMDVLSDKNYEDFLGQVYKEEICKEYKFSDALSHFKVKNKKIINVLVNKCGTGDVLLDIAKMHKNAIFYCSTENPYEYAITLLNLTLYNLTFKIKFGSRFVKERIEFFSDPICNTWHNL